ncbi:MAG: isopentenyl phosphate kinase [Candidatus Helarchaeota archaeon]
MSNLDNIKILKLGGSLITDKDIPFSIRQGILQKCIKQIISYDGRVILIHGGGSFGHPVAKEFKIINGFDPTIPNQILGLSKTHKVMNQLNSIIINNLIDNECPAISIQPSSIFIKNNKGYTTYSINIIENLLNFNIIPVLYGDIVLDTHNSFSIISGDQIAVELCKNIKNYKIDKMIFAFDKDGIFVSNEKNGESNKKNNICLAQEIKVENLNMIKLAKLGNKIDITGGIIGKLKEAEKIAKLNIPVQFINGLINNYILKSLRNQDIISTWIKN